YLARPQMKKNTAGITTNHSGDTTRRSSNGELIPVASAASSTSAAARTSTDAAPTVPLAYPAPERAATRRSAVSLARYNPVATAPRMNTADAITIEEVWIFSQ